jgi:diacylglycerol kinase family enzyme
MAETAMRRRLLVVHNAEAGTRPRSLLTAVLHHLRDKGAEVRTEHAGHIEQDREAARAAVASGAFDAVIAAGGDSTIRGVASGLIGSVLPLGIIPIGTGNVLAREIGIAWDAKSLAENLLSGPAVAIKYGLAGAIPFFTMAGFGFDADVLQRLSTPWKRSVGRSAYAWPVLRETLRAPRPFEVTVDGAMKLPATWVIVTRAARYGGSFVIAPNQTLTTDGFHAVIANTGHRRALAGLLMSLPFGGWDNRRDVTILPCTRLAIEPDKAIAAQIDGERIAPSPPEIELSPDRLSIIVPQASPLASGSTPHRAIIRPESIKRR